MKFTKTKISDVWIIENKKWEDERGYFSETYRKCELDKVLGYSVDFIQDNESKSKKFVLRGLHYQLPPFAQSKLVRVVSGKILDVAIDIRRNSSTFGQYVAVELSSENMRQLFLPQGFAHGFIVLSDEAIVNYKVDNYYAPKYERGIRFDDNELAIKWGIDLHNIIVSEKDALLPLLKEADLFE